MRIALDTNLIAWETPRRLLHGISKETDLSVTVLPQVHEEAAKWLVENEKDLWVERVGEDDAYTGTQREQIVERASEAVREWFEEELKRTETPWSLQGETFEQGVNARRIARNLPVGVVRRGPIEATGDRLVVAQAAVHGVTLLATNDLKSIHHESANDWFKNTLRVNHAVVRTPDECLKDLSNGDEKTIYQWTLAYGERWTATVLQAGEEAIREAYEECLGRLRGGRLRKDIRKGPVALRERTRWRVHREPERGTHTTKQQTTAQGRTTTRRTYPPRSQRSGVGKIGERRLTVLWAEQAERGLTTAARRAAPNPQRQRRRAGGQKTTNRQERRLRA